MIGWLIVWGGYQHRETLRLEDAAKTLADAHAAGRDAHLRIVVRGRERTPTAAEVRRLCDVTARLIAEKESQ